MARDDPAVTLDDILSLVRERQGIDFASYRRATVERRVLGRMRAVFAESHADYLRLLQRDHTELTRLVQQITIKVSAFFRDPDVFSLLEKAVLPALARRAEGRPLRVWVAGCAHGEEPYSLAILLKEGDPGCERPAPVILATDIDTVALETARAASYPEDAVGSLDERRRERYFRREDPESRAHYVLDAAVRDCVRFAYHDLASGKPPPGGGPFDLVCCRNVFIYFAGDLRERAQRLVCGQVASGGVLCLGTSEWLVPSVQSAFRVVDRKSRIFERGV